MNDRIGTGHAAGHRGAPDTGRRTLLKVTGAGVAASGVASGAAVRAAGAGERLPERLAADRGIRHKRGLGMRRID